MSTIYNHRSLQPTGPPAPGGSHSQARLNESLDVVRQEFVELTNELNNVRGQRDEYEAKIASQINELNIIRQSLYDLESQHGKIRQHYEEEIARARANTEVPTAWSSLPTGIASLGVSGAGASGSGGGSGTGSQVVGPGGPPSAGGAGNGGPLGIGGANQIAMPSGSGYGDPYYLRERDQRERERDRERERERMGERERGGDPRERDRERDRDREIRERERERDPRERGDLRDRDMRELRERDLRERERERERERLTDQRDPKRLKSERMKTDRPDHFSPSIGPGHSHLGQGATGPTPKLPPPPSSQGPNATAAAAAAAAAAGMGQGLPPLHGASPGYGTTGPGASSQHGGGDNPNASNSLGLIPLSTSGPSSSSGIPPGPGSALGPVGLSLAGTTTPGASSSFPEEFNVHNILPEFKKEGNDWFAIFNPKVKRVLDVTLVHTLMHESVVCCVRFSADGKYLATGCNRTAQIYDTKTGQKTCVLADDSAGKSGDLYIRSVCFSPDGKYLATGAEDKQIRIWDIAKKHIRNVFDGHQQEIYSLDFSLDGRLIVSGSGDKTARIWDMIDGTSKVLTINDGDSVNNDHGVTSVAISPNGQFVAAGSLDTVVRIWDVNTAQLVERLRGHSDSVYSVAFTPDGKGLVSGSLDKTLKYWDVSDLVVGGRGGSSGGRAGGGSTGGGGVKGRKEGTNGGVANGPGGSGVGGAVARKDGDKSLSAVGGSQCTMNFTGHKDFVLSVAVSHDGAWVVSGSKDRGVQFWDSRTAIVQCMLQGHKNSVISIDLSPAGSILATGSGDWQARIWNYSTI